MKSVRFQISADGENFEDIYEVTATNWPLARIMLSVVSHRLWHWWRGDGFID